ncbi:MAG: OmpA family protein [Bacteroidales bacterium]|nr:OmpA family protein [Bacteroidales bacterium]
MRYYFCLLVTLFLFCPLIIKAQADVSVRKNDFKIEKSGFADAWKHVVEGDSYYDKRGVWYSRAFDEYLKAIVYNNSNPELNYKTGVSALFSDNREEAAGFLLKALELKNNVAEDILLLTGRALQYSGRYSDALGKFDEYLNSSEKKSVKNVFSANKGIEECISALTISKDTSRIEISNMGTNINSGADDYSQLLSSDGKTFYFASRREQAKSSNSYPDSKFDENIFISHKNSGIWGTAIVAAKNLTTKYCETPLYINGGNDSLYIYSGYEKGGDIKISTVNKKGEWKKTAAVPFGINSKGSETSFTFTPSGNEIYFVTDNGKDNIGGKDIYFIKKIKENNWSKPQNAGSLINTICDEESVRFSKTGDTLWFSSQGHNSIGGFDIFYSVRNKEGAWNNVKNCGYPVNTPWDELFFFPSPVEDSIFYFVSNRSGGFGGMDIYTGRILPPVPVAVIEPLAPPEPDTVIIRDTVVVVQTEEPVKELAIYLIGNVKDSETGDPVMAKIDLIDISSDMVISTTASSDIDGSYRVMLPEKKSYLVDLRATGFLADIKQINIPENFDRDVYNLNIDMIKARVGKKVVLNNIMFESGKSILTSGSYEELNRLYNILKDNSLMKIEISGHTDMTGSQSLNLKLSGDRAKTVVEYLVQKGIDRSRMEFKGFGSQQPVADNATPQGRAKNRRVEFKILEF